MAEFDNMLHTEPTFGAKFNNFFTNYGGPLALGAGLVNTAYNMITNKRDFDYQKALQQQIFDREDTAIQRRMQDMMNAGINPNLAAGSGAQAGGIVGRANTPNADIGKSFDYMNALNQIRGQQLSNETASQINEQEKIKTQYMKYQAITGIHSMLANLGLGSIPYIESNGDIGLTLSEGFQDLGMSNYWLQALQERSDLNYQDLLRDLGITTESANLSKTLSETNKNIQDLSLDYLMGQLKLSDTNFDNMLNAWKALTGLDIDKQQLELSLESLNKRYDVQKYGQFLNTIKALPLILFLLGGL